jgi:transglycosylase associated protein
LLDKNININERRTIMIWSLIVGGFIGFIAGGITKKGGAMGIIANIIAGLLGSSVGQSLFGTWGPSMAGMAIVPSILGAVIVIAVVSFFFGRRD